MSWGF